MREWIGCAIWLVFAIAVLTASADLQVMTRFGPGPGFFLRVLGIVLLGLALVQALTLVMARRRGAAGSASVQPSASPESLVAILEADEEDKPMDVDRRSLVRFGLLAVTLFAYGLLLEPLGFLISTTALAWASMTLLGRPGLRSLVEAIAAIVIAYLLFGHVLDVNLPAAHLAPLKALGL